MPIAVAETISPLIRNVFTDSKVAEGYSCGRTKSSCILNYALAQNVREALIEKMKSGPFSLAIDGSSDQNVEEKLNHLTVKYLDSESGMIANQLLDMCVTKGNYAASTSTIFAAVHEKMEHWQIPWSNSVTFGVDNASVNIGKRNSF